MAEYKLWCWNKCPYAQVSYLTVRFWPFKSFQLRHSISNIKFLKRAWVAFLQSGVDFTYCEMNPYENRENKDWRAISIEGLVSYWILILVIELLFRKVPVVQVGSETPGINESLVTMEFINDLANSKLTG